MADQDWLRPAMPVEDTGTAWAGRPEPHFELRPLSLGEVLDRTFALYRSRFWLFAGISMIAATVNVVGQGISLATIRRVATVHTHPAPTPMSALLQLRGAGKATLAAYVVMLVFFLVSAVTQAATALALTQVYLHKPASAKDALRTVAPRWRRWIGIALWQVGSAAWVPAAAIVPAALLLAFGARANSVGLVAIGGLLATLAVLAGFPVGVILYLRNALAIPASVTEGLPIRTAMRRSKVLAAGTKGRIFMVLFIAMCLLEVVAVLQSPVAMLMMWTPNKAHYVARGIALLVTFVGHTVVAPVALIGLTLVYFDQRVRKEALDLELLLESARGAASAASPGAMAGQPVRPEGYAPFL